MNDRLAAWTEALVRVAVRRPAATLAIAALAVASLLAPASRLSSEVGYAGYFGPNDPRVARLTDFLEEFDSGLYALVVFGCPQTPLCERVTDEAGLHFIADLQAEIDRLPNVRKTTSVLNAPVLVRSLEARTLARRDADGHYQLVKGWEPLASDAVDERFLRRSVISADARNAGIVVELQSLQSERMSATVHGLLALLPRFERRLGAPIHIAGDPIWTVVSADDLNADSTTLTVLMFVMIAGVLWALFRSAWLTVVPLLAVGTLVGAVYGLIAVLGIPMTAILTALPPVLVVIAITSSIHLLTAFLRSADADAKRALASAAGEVGPGCFWAAFTTAAGFGSFLWSDLASFRHFGGVAATGLALSFVLTFTVLPALLCLRPDVRSGSRKLRDARGFVDHALATLQGAVGRRPRYALLITLVAMSGLAAGAHRIHYETNFGFGERHFVYRSLRYIESNFRKPMSTELVIDIPEGRRIYDPDSLRLLARIEAYFEREPSTGAVWSFLDFLEEAYRVDKGHSAVDFETLVASVSDEMPIVASHEKVFSFWSETVISEKHTDTYHDRARISVDRAWLNDANQGPYVDRLRAEVAEINQEWGAKGYRVELEGGLILADLFLDVIRETQWKSFASALVVVVATLGCLLWGHGRLIFWAALANAFPAAALLGTMGWAGIGIDPANSMVGAILIAIAVDDTVHVCLRYTAERGRGQKVRAAIGAVFRSVGPAVVITSVCLALGFSVLMFSRWGGLVSFGLLASLGVLYAVVCDLILLPAALISGAADRAESAT